MNTKDLCCLGDPVNTVVLRIDDELFARVYATGRAAGSLLEVFPAHIRDCVDVLSCADEEVELATCRLWRISSGDAGLSDLIDEIADTFDQCISGGFFTADGSVEWEVGLPSGSYDLLLSDEEQDLLRMSL